MNGYFVIFAVKSEDNRPIFIMKITDNIIIYEAHEFPQLLMQPFYSDYSKYDYYNVYFFDSQTTTLYYFHNNI